MLQAFVYDATGNLTKKAEGGTVTRTATDCTGDTVTALTYNSVNRLTQVIKTGLTTEQYAYDHEGRRIKKTVGTTPSNFSYMGPDIVAEYPATFTTPTALFTHGPNWDDPILRQTGMGPTAIAKYFHQDGLGSVVAFSPPRPAPPRPASALTPGATAPPSPAPSRSTATPAANPMQPA